MDICEVCGKLIGRLNIHNCARKAFALVAVGMNSIVKNNIVTKRLRIVCGRLKFLYAFLTVKNCIVINLLMQNIGQIKANDDIIRSMEKESIATNPARSSIRYPVTQAQIDDILNNELKGFTFPVKPIYNSRMRDNGKTVGEMYPWGQLKQIKKIEVGKQDVESRDFLIDTLLHEFYEAYIMAKQYTDDFYRELSRLGDDERHKWINKQIEEFFRKMRD